MRSNATTAVRLILTLTLLTVALAMHGPSGAAQVGHNNNIVMAQVDLGGGGGGGGVTSATFNLYKVQASCCDACKTEPKRPCRKCCAPLKDADYSVTLKEDGVLKFENIVAGSYLLVNKADGLDAGLEKVIEVKEDSKINLGKIAIDYGMQRRLPGHISPPPPNQ